MRRREPIKNAQDYNEAACEILDCCWEDLIAKNKTTMTRPVDEDDDPECQEWDHMYTNKAMRILDRWVGRLTALGAKYYGEVEIRCSHVIEI